MKEIMRALVVKQETFLKKEIPESDESSYDSLASRVNFWKEIRVQGKDKKKSIFVRDENISLIEPKKFKQKPRRKFPGRRMTGLSQLDYAFFEKG